MDVGVTDDSEIIDEGNSDKSEIMDKGSIDNGADNVTSAPDTTEIVDNGDIVHSTNRDMSISVVIDNSVPEKSLKSAITDNNAPNQSDIVNGAHKSSLDANVCSGTCQTSSDIDESPQKPILKCYNPKTFGSESFSRDFNPAWYIRYPWLNYEFETNKACCYPCQKYLNTHDFTFDNWRKPERLTKHQKSENHQTAMGKCIDSTANKKRNTHKQDNTAQRGHDEQRDGLSNSSDVNRGNFLELIHLRCKDIAWLKDKIDSQLQKLAQWTSPVIQNELPQIIADLIRERTTNDERASGWYGIILDETSDISRTEQVSLCLSFAQNGRKKQAFIGFYSTKSSEGEVLYELVKSSITKLNLDLKNIVGKAFDGVANMNGLHKGLSTRMEECSPLSIYAHCYGHVLNLALQDTMTQIETLRNALGIIQALYNFLEASPNRHAPFTDTEVQGEDLKLTLKSLSATRWSCR
ncbi:zinc finger MYM-type protein 1-like [Montipora capricornis]|uniref:zinc finger MYM-type protein 1-like n=1 Tax=Montipora foliosa TaxID=591990 RepID=UPI0035F104B5